MLKPFLSAFFVKSAWVVPDGRIQTLWHNQIPHGNKDRAGSDEDVRWAPKPAGVLAWPVRSFASRWLATC